jgi:iron complex outermembrane receptor protein
VFDNEVRCAEQGRECNPRQEGFVVRTDDGGLIFAYSPAINAAKLETNGLDIDANYRFDETAWGRFNLTTGLSYIFSYKRQDAPTAPLLERVDTLNGNGEIYPELRLNAMLGWGWNRWTSALGANYIGKVSDCDAPDKAANDPVCNNEFDDYLTFDLQLGYETPWNSNVTVGARNILDEEPKVSQYTKSVSTSGTFYGLHDIDQRVLFVRFTQNF